MNIDILLATYNGGKYIDEQLDSILAQTYTEWYLIVHDDGSTDNTLDIIKYYQNLYPEKIQIINDGVRCGGAKENFAHLMRFSTAPYIMFCDQDDVWLPNKIECTFDKLLEIEKKKPGIPILVHSDLMVVDEELNILSDSMFTSQRLPKQILSTNQLLVQNNITGCTVVINRQALLVSLPIPDVAIMHDWWIACKVLQNKGVIFFVDNALINYRQHSNNTVGSTDINYLYIMKIFNIYFSYFKLKKIIKQAKKINPNVNICSLLYEKIFFLIRRLMNI